MSSFPKELSESVENWLKWDRNEKTRGEIQKLVESKDVIELSKRLLKRIEFGTAGNYF